MKVNSILRAAAVALVLSVGSTAMAGVITVSNEQVTDGGTIGVALSFANNAGGDIGSIEFCVNYDDAQIDSVDTANCLENLPTPWAGGFGTACSAPPTGNCPNGIRVALVDLACGGGALPDQDPIGTVEFTTAAGLAVGTVIDLDIELIDVIRHDPCGQQQPDLVATLSDGSIEITAGPAPDLGFVPADGTPINFGNVIDGNSSTETVQVCNSEDGDAGSIIDGISAVITDGAPEFSVDASDCAAAELSPNQCCNIVVTFAPNDVDSFDGELEITTSAGNGTFDLAGVGTEGPQPNFVVDPPFGPVDLETGVPGQVLSAGGTVTNEGDAPGEFSCELTDDAGGVFSTTPASPFSVGNVAANGSVGFTLSCTIPDDATDQEVFTGELSCTGDGGFSGTHDLSCTAEVQPDVAVAPTSGTPVNLSGVAGSSNPVSAAPQWSNSGAADSDDMICTLTAGDVDGDISVSLIGDTTFDIEAGATGFEPFSIQCDVSDATAGDSWEGNLTCSNQDFESSHPISCTARDAAAVPINTLQPLGLILFALLMLLVGGISIRMFRV